MIVKIVPSTLDEEDSDFLDVAKELERHNDYRRAIALQGVIKNAHTLLGVPITAKVVLPNTAKNRTAVGAIAAKQRTALAHPSAVIRVTK